MGRTLCEYCCWQPQWWCGANTIADKAYILIWMWYELYIIFFLRAGILFMLLKCGPEKSIHEKVWHCCLFMHFSATLSMNIGWNYCLIWFNISGLRWHLCDECSLQDALLWFCLKNWPFWIYSINTSRSGPILSDVLNPLNAKLVGRKVNMYLPLKERTKHHCNACHWNPHVMEKGPCSSYEMSPDGFVTPIPINGYGIVLGLVLPTLSYDNRVTNRGFWLAGSSAGSQ